MWYFQGKEFKTEDIGDYVGFVYEITNVENGRKYIGKKNFWSRKTLPPLKGQKRKRKVVKESDWQDYFGSSEEVKELVEQRGREIFDREILHLCKNKGSLSYMETKEILSRDALLRDDYYNGIVQCRINKNHLKHLWIINSDDSRGTTNTHCL